MKRDRHVVTYLEDDLDPFLHFPICMFWEILEEKTGKRRRYRGDPYGARGEISRLAGSGKGGERILPPFYHYVRGIIINVQQHLYSS